MNDNAEYYEITTETEVLFPVSGPDLTDPNTGRTVIPERVRMRFNRRFTPAEDGGREWASVAVYGPRRLKSGEAGREISSFGWDTTVQYGHHGGMARPDWLTQELADHMPDGWAPQLVSLKTCDCGNPIPAGRLTCWQCRFENDDHGTDHTDEEAS